MAADETCFCGLPIDGHPTFNGEVLHETGVPIAEGHERCEHVVPLPMRCELPAGHSGAHGSSANLPDEVSDLVQAVMLEAERAEKQARKAWRTYRAMSALLLLTVVYIVVVSII